MILKNTEFGNTKDVSIVELGSGDVLMAAAKGDDYSCVLFKQDTPHEIGAEGIGKGLNSDQWTPDIAITFKDVRSIEVLEEKIKEAKEILKSIES